MNFEEAVLIFERVLGSKQFNKIQQLVLQYSWQGLSYSEIAKVTNYDEGYIKDTGSKVWQILSDVFEQKVTKQNLQAIIKHYYRQSNPLIPSSQDWGEAIDTSIFYGRNQELITLSQWISDEKCRLIAILGIGGVGKTTLSVRLAEQVQGEFEYIFWRSLRDSPPLTELLTALLQLLLKENSPLPETDNSKLVQLQKCLQTIKCLIIFDNFEALFAPNQQGGIYREGYEGYGELLQRIGETRHQSCLLITSRDTPAEIEALQGTSLPVRAWKLQGLDENSSYQLLTTKGLEGSEAEFKQLVQCYWGNPLALKIVASSIHSLFAGDINHFLSQKVAVFNSIRNLLHTQIERLSKLEQQLLYWLAINREPVTISVVQSDLIPSQSMAALLETLTSLIGRSLVERTAEGFTLQPVVMEYLTEQLITQVYSEINLRYSLTFFKNYALLKATAKDYIRDSQIRVIIKPIIARWENPQTLIEQLKGLLAQLRTRNSDDYTVGNLINLLIHLQVDLTGYDFSHFCVWQAYLADVKLQQVNFVNANLSKTVFAETFGGVSCVTFSPDSKLLATSDTSGEVQIWDLVRGRQINAFKADTVWTWTVIFSPDGTILATAGDDHVVKLWETQTGQCLGLLTGHINTINGLAFHPNGHLLASCSLDESIHLWQVKDLSYTLLLTLQGHQKRVWSIAFSPDGETLVSASEDTTLKLWNVFTGECLQTLKGHSSWVKTIAFSPDGKTIASGSFDGVIKLWSVATAECLISWQGHQETVTMIAFSPDGCLLASGSYDNLVKVWDVSSHQCLKTFTEHENRIWSVAFSPDGQYLASGGDDHATRLWHLKTGQCAKTWKGHTNSILSLALNQEQQWMATGHEDQTVKLWHLQTGNIFQTLRGHTNRVWSVAFLPQSDLILASGSADRTIKLWNIETGQCLMTLYGHQSWVWSVAFSSDGQRLASSSYDQTIKLWDHLTGECLNTLKDHTAPVISVIFSPKGQYLASSSLDSTVKLWEVSTGRCLRTFQGHDHGVWAIAFSPDGQYLASGSYDRTVKLWNIGTGECVSTFAGHTAAVMSVAFYPSGQQFASGSFDQKIKVWDLLTGECLDTFSGHTGIIPALIIQESDEILISGSFDETIRFWHQTGECLQTFRTPRPYDEMNITGVTGLNEAQKSSLQALGAIAL